MKQLVLKNEYLISNPTVGLVSLYSFLGDLKLHNRESRNRSRFMALLEPRVKEIQEERSKLATEYAEKNKDGQPVSLDKSGKETQNPSEIVGYRIPPENQKKLADEFQEIMDEEFVVDVTPEREGTVKTVKEIVLDCDLEFEGLMASQYDNWCQAFENMREAPKEHKKAE